MAVELSAPDASKDTQAVMTMLIMYDFHAQWNTVVLRYSPKRILRPPNKGSPCKATNPFACMLLKHTKSGLSCKFPAVSALRV